MHSRTIIVAVAMAAFAIAGSCAPAQAHDYEEGVYSGPKTAFVKRPGKARRSHGGQIACTFLGCQPIPSNCRPATGYSFGGEPTGFDVVVCR